MNSEDTPWVRLNEGDPDAGIKGNSSGLTKLRDKLNEAIEFDHSQMEDFNCDFCDIQQIDDSPPQEPRIGLSARCFSILLLLIFLLGILTLMSLMAIIIAKLIE